jgi:hypothetical protein
MPQWVECRPDAPELSARLDEPLIKVGILSNGACLNGDQNAALNKLLNRPSQAPDSGLVPMSDQSVTGLHHQGGGTCGQACDPDLMTVGGQFPMSADTLHPCHLVVGRCRAERGVCVLAEQVRCPVKIGSIPRFASGQHTQPGPSCRNWPTFSWPMFE